MIRHSNETAAYPLLTNEILIALRRKIEAKQTTPSDCYFIDHYLTSIGKPPGYLKALLLDEGVTSFEDIQNDLKENPRDFYDLRASSITGYLLGCIWTLRERVLDGEKIY